MVNLNDESLMLFGQFKGQKFANVPAWYMLWIYDNLQLREDFKQYIDKNRKVLENEKKRDNRERYK